ncbi:MAG: anti-sigma factor [Myxococcota bacterium]
MAGNKEVGGLWCFDVLERLSEYVDGELSASERRKVEAHLEGCDECTKFGGEFGAVVKALKAKLASREDVPADVARRLEEALAKR